MRLRRVRLRPAQPAVGFSWGPERREPRWRPLSLAPATHTRTFLQCVAVELEAKDTLWKSEFHALLAEGGFLLGEGVRVCACVHTAPGAGGGRGPWAEGCWGDVEGDPRVSRHRMALAGPGLGSLGRYLEGRAQ